MAFTQASPFCFERKEATHLYEANCQDSFLGARRLGFC
jgi:hypothetical protein